MKIIVTGATGFLGRRVADLLAQEHVVVRQGFSHAGPDIVQADLRKHEELKQLLDTAQPEAVIHCAAYRDPDFCESHPEEARCLNVQPVSGLAEMLPGQVRLVHISTDYVFGGDKAPYHEEDPTAPINVYGRTKRDAETAALSRSGSLVLRIPLLVGAGPDWATSGFIYKTAALLEQSDAVGLDHHGLRFPTWIDDVGEALRFLLEGQMDGIYHASSDRGATKYELALQLAEFMGISADHIQPSKDAPAKAVRPENTRLDTSKIRAAGFDRFHDFETAARHVLKLYGKLKG